MATRKCFMLRSTFNLVLYFSCFSIIVCSENSKDLQLSPWNDKVKRKLNAEPFDWDKWDRLRKITSPPNTFDWDELDRLRKITLPPDTFDWDELDRLRKITLPPDTFDWDKLDRLGKITLPPDTFDHFHEERLNYVPIVIIGSIVAFLVAISCLACLLCGASKRNTQNSIYNTIPVPNYQHNPIAEHSQLPVNSRIIAAGRPPIILEFNNPVSNPSNPSTSEDQPPPYHDVVGDMSGEAKFPEIKLSIPDTPPPKYDEENVPRY